MEIPARMQAWRQDRYGGTEVVRREDVPTPEPGRGEVLLRVRATALNAADRHLMRGEPLVVRLGFGLRRPRQAVRGMDVAGTVVALGADVSGFAVGDEVVGELPGGGLAEYAVAPVARLVPRPASVSPEDASALPIAAGTAWLALEQAQVAAGHRVLVLGASGGVGTFAVQLARIRGARVDAFTGERSRDLVAGLGAEQVHDYRRTTLAGLAGEGYDAVIDIAGTEPLPLLQHQIRDGGRIALVAGGEGRLLGPLPRLAASMLRSVGSRRKLVAVVAGPRPEVTADLLGMIADGRLRVVQERTWPLAEADAALAHIDAGHAVGKVIVVP